MKREVKQKDALRLDMQLWTERYTILDQENVDLGIKSLARS